MHLCTYYAANSVKYRHKHMGKGGEAAVTFVLGMFIGMRSGTSVLIMHCML